MPVSKSATCSSPRARAMSIACSLSIPLGSPLPMAPANTMSVARPSTRGPVAESATLITAVTNTAITLIRSGRRLRIRRLPEARKSSDF